MGRGLHPLWGFVVFHFGLLIYGAQNLNQLPYPFIVDDVKIFDFEDLDQSAPVTICAGTSVTLGPAAGSPNCDFDGQATFQWYENMIPLAGETNQNLTITPATTSTYTLERSFDGDSYSEDVLVTVEGTALSVTQTTDIISACPDNIIPFNVTITNTDPLNSVTFTPNVVLPTIPCGGGGNVFTLLTTLPGIQTLPPGGTFSFTYDVSICNDPSAANTTLTATVDCINGSCGSLASATNDVGVSSGFPFTFTNQSGSANIISDCGGFTACFTPAAAYPGATNYANINRIEVDLAYDNNPDITLSAPPTLIASGLSGATVSTVSAGATNATFNIDLGQAPPTWT